MRANVRKREGQPEAAVHETRSHSAIIAISGPEQGYPVNSNETERLNLYRAFPIGGEGGGGGVVVHDLIASRGEQQNGTAIVFVCTEHMQTSQVRLFVYVVIRH